MKKSKIARSTKKWHQIKKKKIFFAHQNRLKNRCLRVFFLICAYFTPLWPIFRIFICLSYFCIISVGGQNFSEAIFTQKMTRKKKKKFFFTDQIRLKNNCLRGFFLIWAHYTPLWPLLWIFICLSFFFIILLYGQNFSRAIFSPKMSPKNKKFFFFADQIRLKNKCLRELSLI